MMRILLGYMSSDYSDEDVDRLETLALKLASEGGWSREPPEFIDQEEEDSRTLPEDEVLWTVGVALDVSDRGEEPKTPVEELVRLIHALASFSKENAIDFEVQLGATFVGEIVGGVPDTSIREGLLASW